MLRTPYRRSRPRPVGTATVQVHTGRHWAGSVGRHWAGSVGRHWAGSGVPLRFGSFLSVCLQRVGRCGTPPWQIR
jgi:hypothetical protein